MGNAKRNSPSRPRSHFIRGTLLLAFLACADGNPPESSSPADSASPPVEESPGVESPDSSVQQPAAGGDWTSGIVEVAGTLTGAEALPIVRAVRSAAQDGFDRLTVELGPGSGLPGYHVEYVDRPLIQCGSGQEIHPVGSGWLELRLFPTNAHTEAGAPTLPGREIPLQGRLFRRLYMTCDFEVVVTLVVAVDSPNAYKIFALADPPRLVLDVRH